MFNKATMAGKMVWILWFLAHHLSSSAAGFLPEQTASLPNANHIFNAIHSSMRQWGSSIHHNGMSFFLATIPEGIQLYHGSPKSTPIQGTEWLAFEPEHAMVFAKHHLENRCQTAAEEAAQDVISPDFNNEKDCKELKPGYLHTYITAKKLQLIYIDGMSAANSVKGTQESQDRILLNDTLNGLATKERPRVNEVCRMARDIWSDQIDGIIRMEAGFEVILCSSEHNLKNIRITQARTHQILEGRPTGQIGEGQEYGSWTLPPDGYLWIKAISARYHGIGGNRVVLNYDHFVTAYAYGLDLFKGGGKLPRLEHIKTQDLDPIRQALNSLIMADDVYKPSFNWQAVADMVIERYADSLKYLVSGDFTTIEFLQAEIERILRPFIDYSARNPTDEAKRCSDQFIVPHAPTETLAGQAVSSVLHSICSTLVAVLNEENYQHAIDELVSLVEYLSWSTWKECRGCKNNEICVIPFFPMGSAEDYENPQCRDAYRPYITAPNYWNNSKQDGVQKYHRHEEL